MVSSMADGVSTTLHLLAPLVLSYASGITCYNGCRYSVDCTAPSPGGWHGKSCSDASSALWSSEGPVCMKACTASRATSHLPERQGDKDKEEGTKYLGTRERECGKQEPLD